MLTQLSTLKSRLGLELFDPTDGNLLTNIIKHVSARFALECNRVFDHGENLGFEYPADQTNIITDRPPIESVSSFDLKSSESEGWVVQSTPSCLLSPTRSVIQLTEPLGTCGQLARVTYTGGYVLPGAIPTANQRPLPDEIEAACVEQAVYWYQCRAQLGISSVSNESGLVQRYQSSDLLPQVRAVLRKYERMVV